MTLVCFSSMAAWVLVYFALNFWLVVRGDSGMSQDFMENVVFMCRGVRDLCEGRGFIFVNEVQKNLANTHFLLSTLKGNGSMSRLWERWTQYCQMEGNAYKSELWGGQASALLLGKPAGTQGHCLLASDIRSWVLWEGSSRACCRRWDWPCCSFGSLVETYAYSGKNGCKIDFIILWKVRF